jgi:SAM-dependent methyltransferase
MPEKIIAEHQALPSAELLIRVGGSDDAEAFLRIGKRCASDIRAAVRAAAQDLESFTRVLDFGCGCGRTLRWFAENSRTGQFHGTDTDGDAVAWCRNGLPFASFVKNGHLPPLPYPNAGFDLVYSISVFTHLREDYQRPWLDEMARIIAPSGLFVFTINSQASWPSDCVQEITTNGFKFFANEGWSGSFPEWYGTTYQTVDYVRAAIGTNFRLLTHLPQSMNTDQDVIVARRI